MSTAASIRLIYDIVTQALSHSVLSANGSHVKITHSDEGNIQADRFNRIHILWGQEEYTISVFHSGGSASATRAMLEEHFTPEAIKAFTEWPADPALHEQLGRARPVTSPGRVIESELRPMPPSRDDEGDPHDLGLPTTQQSLAEIATALQAIATAMYPSGQDHSHPSTTLNDAITRAGGFAS